MPVRSWERTRNVPRRGTASEKKRAEHKDFLHPDEIRSFGKGRLELIKIGGGVVGRLTLEPGWRWSEHVRPVAHTEWCEEPHFQYQLSGRLHIQTADGMEFETHAGEVTALPSGHDAWVVGDEAVVLIDWSGASNYAKQEENEKQPSVGPRDSRGARTTIPERLEHGERRVSERRRPRSGRSSE